MVIVVTFIVGPPPLYVVSAADFAEMLKTQCVLIVLVIVVTFIVGPPPTLRFSGNVDFAMVLV